MFSDYFYLQAFLKVSTLFFRYFQVFPGGLLVSYVFPMRYLIFFSGYNGHAIRNRMNKI